GVGGGGWGRWEGGRREVGRGRGGQRRAAVATKLLPGRVLCTARRAAGGKRIAAIAAKPFARGILSAAVRARQHRYSVERRNGFQQDATGSAPRLNRTSRRRIL